MALTVQRLYESARPSLVAHFLALPAADRHLRFGAALAAGAIVAYVEAIDFDRDAVFGFCDDGLRLLGAAHLAFGPDLAELGVSVLAEHRSRSIGSALFARAALHARNRGVYRLLMHCLLENGPIMRIARKSGMTIVIAAGDVDAHLELMPPCPSSIVAEAVTDGFALYDYALKAQVATWERIITALRDATRAGMTGSTG